MTDIVSKEQRSKMMGSIKSVSKLEDKVSKELWGYGIRYRRNTRTLMGKPDFSIKKYRTVIFIDSCFWHMCPEHGNIPETNRDFWENKLYRNVERDMQVTNYYNENGWYILRVWEHEFKKDFPKAVEKIADFIKEIQADSK